jgi:hypothetical protein
MPPVLRSSILCVLVATASQLSLTALTATNTLALAVTLCVLASALAAVRSGAKKDRWAIEPYDPITHTLDDEYQIAHFRFKNSELSRMIAVLPSFQGRQFLRTACGCKFTPLEGMQIMCTYLSYPKRWKDLENDFRSDEHRLRKIYYKTMELFENDTTNLLHFDPQRVAHHFPQWALACQAHTYLGAPHSNCVGFLDCKLFPVCKPFPSTPGLNLDALQKSLFCGQKWTHGIKVLGINLPNGIACAWGPMESIHHDAWVYHASGVETDLRHGLRVGGVQYFLVADSAFPSRPWIRSFKKDQPVGSPGHKWNYLWASCRVSVEWMFGALVQQFGRLSYRRNNKVFQGEQRLLAKSIMNTFVLTNALTCLRGSQTNCHLNTQPPSLEDYFQGNW